jgi:hypothetical protein
MTGSVSIFLPQKLLLLSNQKYGGGDPEKIIPDPDPRVKKAPDPGSGSATLSSSLCYLVSRHLISAHDVGQFSGQLHRCGVPVCLSYCTTTINKFNKEYNQ